MGRGGEVPDLPDGMLLDEAPLRRRRRFLRGQVDDAMLPMRLREVLC